MATKKKSKFSGRWRIVETSVWASDVLDLDGVACLAFEADGFGRLKMIALSADVDYRENGDRIEFSWAGFDEGDPVSGRGFARIVTGDSWASSSFIAETSARSLLIA